MLTSDTQASEFPDCSPEGGRIVFEREVGGVRDVYTMNSDGANVTNLTAASSFDNYPAWSPDGRTIVFSTDRYGNRELAAIGAYGGVVTQVTHGEFYARYPAFCRGDDYAGAIAYTSYRNGNDDVFVTSLYGSAETNLTAHSAKDYCPRWSSDGRLIAFTSTRSGNRDIWVQEVAPPHTVWQVTKHAAYDMTSDLGSPTMQTERVLIGPNGSDRGGKNPLYPSAPAVIAAFDDGGYRNLVRIGVAAADLAGMQVRPLSASSSQIAAGPSLAGVEVSAKKVANLREDAGWGKPARVWDFNALNAGMVLLYFKPDTGKLVTVIPVKDSAYPAAAGSAPATSYQATAAGDGVQLAGSFSGVFDAEGRNLAESGASSVTLGADGQVLQVN